MKLKAKLHGTLNNYDSFFLWFIALLTTCPIACLMLCALTYNFICLCYVTKFFLKYDNRMLIICNLKYLLSTCCNPSAHFISWLPHCVLFMHYSMKNVTWSNKFWKPSIKSNKLGGGFARGIMMAVTWRDTDRMAVIQAAVPG